MALGFVVIAVATGLLSAGTAFALDAGIALVALAYVAGGMLGFGGALSVALQTGARPEPQSTLPLID